MEPLSFRPNVLSPWERNSTLLWCIRRRGDRIGRCRLLADFVAEVAEEESGRWRRAINLACHSPVRALAGDYSNDCQRDFGMTLTLTPRMRPRAEAAVPRAWPTCGGSERSLPA